MKLKNVVLFDEESLNDLSGFVKQKIPLVVRYKLEKCIEVFSKEEPLVKKTRIDLFKEYGKPTFDENGNPTGFSINDSSEENKAKLFSELSSLLNVEFEIPIENKIEVSVSDLDKRGVILDEKEFQSLKFLLEFKD